MHTSATFGAQRTLSWFPALVLTVSCLFASQSSAFCGIPCKESLPCKERALLTFSGPLLLGLVHI